MNTHRSSERGGVAFFFAGLLGALAVGWILFPQLLYSEIEQPFVFSHAAHVDGAGMYCEDCHYYREDGSYNGFPTTESCAECHEEVMTGVEAEVYFVENYVKQGYKEVEWKTYQYQPDNVYFSHIAHEGFECNDCHPKDIGQSETTPTYYENRITGYSKDTMKMKTCERCHAEFGASNACYICHM
jgi:hypothetical protein